MRPMYETSEDLGREGKVKAILEAHWKAKLHKLPIAYKLDFLAEREEGTVAWIEVKVRTNAMRQYPTMMLSLSKFLIARQLTETTGLPSFLVVQWTDKLGFVDMNQISYTVAMGGRKDRNDSQDIDPSAYIAIDHFQEFKQ